MDATPENDTIKEELSESGNPVGIEYEDEDEASLMEPFDPDKISIEQKVIALETVIRRLRQQLINLSPVYQRNEVWDDVRRSRLIESLMLRIPLPMFYVAVGENGSWEVVDGLQRLSTIKKFIIDKSNDRLILKKLEFLGDIFNKKDYVAIESDSSNLNYLNNLLETELRFTVINPSTPEAVKRNIFKRINTGGMPLTLQEIRNALYQGHSTELLYRLSKSIEFKSAINTEINDTRMAARELVLRFIAFNLFDYKKYPEFALDTWLTSSMQAINLMPENEIQDFNLNKIEKKIGMELANSIKVYTISQLENNFKTGMNRAKLLFGNNAFRKYGQAPKRRTPINRYLFESWSNILTKLSENDFEKLLLNKKTFEENLIEMTKNNAYINSIGKYASQGKYVMFRYSIIQSLIKHSIKNELVSFPNEIWSI
ncbi:DUF262 domain-containing protein [Acinetobacter nosocomialis]|uniref:DUF262 domain-containing protein n=1 Tax=Acinetobacter nosocomialis TaxID=106654 RepID=UPI0010940574|nr:DUF262 domain-containing protein [Acinetobacter nosocomialis]QCA01154.1 DUF262 domain-containing protein [Acinetobacter nosocomialis]